jgi:signal transduction histidine kinase
LPRAAWRPIPYAVAVAGAVWSYTGLVVLWLLLHWRHPEATWWLANWLAVPGQLTALVLIGVRVRSGIPRHAHRTAWWVVLAFVVLNAGANVVWNATWANPRVPGLSLGDSLYLLDYLLLVAALALLYVDAGGSWQRPRFWLDGATLIVATLAVLWAFLFAPFLPTGPTLLLNLSTTLLYAFFLTAVMTMGALLAMQVVGMRGPWVPLLLIGAGLAEVAWEIAWLAGELKGHSYVGLFYNFGDALCFALISTAAVINPGALPRRDVERSAEANAFGFVPVLAVLVSVAFVAGSATTTQGWTAWIRVLLVLLGAALLVSRQRGVRRELQRLNRVLMLRESDARVTELVRCSDDLLIVVDAERRLSFVSPAALTVLGVAAEDLKDRAAERLLGTAHEARMREFLDALARTPSHNAELEVMLATPPAVDRIVQIIGTQQLANPLIAGTSLVLRDVTAQRALEREIIDIATRERRRLCEQIHEGLGQELSGIVLLLQGAATQPKSDPQAQRQSLEDLVGYLNRTIGITRQFAEELSPIHIADGSLSGALQQLAREISARTHVPVAVDALAEDPPIPAGIAEHLYRIAQDALNTAAQVPGCTSVQVALLLQDREVLLTVRALGPVGPMWSAELPDLARRMLQYRLRLIGGATREQSIPGGGTQLTVSVALRSIAG